MYDLAAILLTSTMSMFFGYRRHLEKTCVTFPKCSGTSSSLNDILRNTLAWATSLFKRCWRGTAWKGQCEIASVQCCPYMSACPTSVCLPSPLSIWLLPECVGAPVCRPPECSLVCIVCLSACPSVCLLPECWSTSMLPTRLLGCIVCLFACPSVCQSVT